MGRKKGIFEEMRRRVERRERKKEARINRLVREHPWDFLDAPSNCNSFLALERMMSMMMSIYRPLSTEIPVMETENFSELEDWGNSEIRRLGNQKFFAEYTTQVFGVPEEDRYAYPLLEYCRKAVEFLYERLEGLKEYDIRWTVVENRSYEKDFGGRGFIGNSSYDVRWVNIRDLKTGKIISKTGGTIYLREGFGILSTNPKTHKLSGWFLFISTGRSAIVSPFSEVMPLTTIESASRYRNKTGSPALAMKADEALVEGISYMLAGEISEKLGIPNGYERVEDMKENLLVRPEYEYLRQSIEWIKRNGIQKAFDLYMEDPGKFLSAIGAGI